MDSFSAVRRVHFVHAGRILKSVNYKNPRRQPGKDSEFVGIGQHATPLQVGVICISRITCSRADPSGGSSGLIRSTDSGPP